MMRILIVTNMYPDATRPYNGIFVAEQVAAIKAYHPNVEFDVCYIDGAKGKKEYLKSIFYVNRRIRKKQYDLVHIHFGLSGLYLLSPFKSKVPTLVTFHGSDIQLAGGNGLLTVMISRFVAKKADACITLNNKMDTMVKAYNSNSFILPCAVNTKFFYPHKTQEKQCIIQVVFPCNHGMAVKDYPLFCKVLEILRIKYGVECEERELAGLSRTQVADLFNHADLLLMTSKSEGSPQAVKEALACNLPVVSTPVGDVENLLSGVKDCFVSQTRNEKELAHLVMKSLSHESDGMTGDDKIRVLQLDEKSIADKIYEIYEKSQNQRH